MECQKRLLKDDRRCQFLNYSTGRGESSEWLCAGVMGVAMSRILALDPWENGKAFPPGCDSEGWRAKPSGPCADVERICKRMLMVNSL